MMWTIIERIARSNVDFVVAPGVMLLFGFTLYGLFFIKIPVENEKAATLVIGALLAAVGTIVGYRYGSSAGARESRQFLQDKVANPDPAQTVERQTVQNQTVGGPAATPPKPPPPQTQPRRRRK